MAPSEWKSHHMQVWLFPASRSHVYSQHLGHMSALTTRWAGPAGSTFYHGEARFTQGIPAPRKDRDPNQHGGHSMTSALHSAKSHHKLVPGGIFQARDAIVILPVIDTETWQVDLVPWFPWTSAHFQVITILPPKYPVIRLNSEAPFLGSGPLWPVTRGQQYHSNGSQFWAAPYQFFLPTVHGGIW